MNTKYLLINKSLYRKLHRFIVIRATTVILISIIEKLCS